MKTRLTPADLNMIVIALQLRIEACEENKETKQAKKWSQVSGKLEAIFRERAKELLWKD